ncbi:RFC checkpoint protein Rad17 [Marasmius crinis-equi]|uniref:RFC checkpoint protein Rad17 n=1 Tax=Marasmius crinis-equi TaxID=585013 RepID=A0ABR3ELU6_9AGAR
MAPKSSQKSISTPESQKKSTKPAPKRPKLKVGSLGSTSDSGPAMKRLDPLNAFVSLPPSQPKLSTSQTSTKTKGKGKSKETEIIDVDTLEETEAGEDSVRAEDGDRLWVDMYEPTTEGELAVHVRKVEDVRRWLFEAFGGGPSGKLKKYRRVLVLTGPAGTAKTSTVKVLSREMDFEILEWKTAMNDPLENGFDDGLTYASSSRTTISDYNYESSYTKFEAFLARAASCDNVFSSSTSKASGSRGRKIILLEDLPNLGHLDTRAKFHAALKAIVEASDPNPVPIIIVVSDSGLRGEAGDERLVSGMWRKDLDGAVDLYSMLPKDLLNSQYVTQLRFNPIAPTLLKKALQALLNTHYSSAPKGSRKSPITPQLLDVIIDSANGDVRSAIMTLQFACIRLGSQAKSSKGRKKEGKLDSDVLVESITRREQSLVLFHLMGKVLYNKRKGDPPAASAQARDIRREEEIDRRLKDPPPLPPHLKDHERKASRVDIDRIYADSPIDSSLFSLYIHQNYTQFTDDIDHCDGIADWLSWADSSGGEAWYQVNPHRFHLLALGTLHSLPAPVERRSQRVFKPEFFDFLQKEKDAWEGVKDVRSWLIRQATTKKESEDSDASLGWDMSRWSPSLIATELGAALKLRDSQRSTRPPVSHRRFSVLQFVKPEMSTSSAEQLGESEAGMEDEALAAAAEREEGGLWNEEGDSRQNSGGWLDSDDIEEF